MGIIFDKYTIDGKLFISFEYEHIIIFYTLIDWFNKYFLSV